MAIYGNTMSFGGGGQNDTLPPLLDNFRANKTDGIFLKDLPSKTKVKLGRYGGKELKWLLCRDSADKSLRLILDGSSVTDIGNMPFDAAEPSNSDSDRRSYGNNRYIYSNLHQWLNSNKPANQWYTSQHGADAPPDYQNKDGFLKDWTADELSVLVNKEWTTTKTDIDGGGTENFISKVTLSSTTEMGLRTGTGGSKLDIFNSEEDRNLNKKYWCRTPSSNYTYIVGCVNDNGRYVEHAASIAYGVRPLLALSDSTLVSSKPDSEGYYTIVKDLKITISADKMPVSRAADLAGAVWVYGDHLPKNVNDGTKTELSRDEIVADSGTIEKSVSWDKSKNFYARQFTYNPKKQYQTMTEGGLTSLNPNEFTNPKKVYEYGSVAPEDKNLIWIQPDGLAKFWNGSEWVAIAGVYAEEEG